LPNVAVDIVAKDNSTYIKQTLTTGNDGKFTVTDVEAGVYSLTFSVSGYAQTTKDVSVAAGRTVTANTTLSPDKNVLSASPQTVDFGEVETNKSIIIQNNGLDAVSYEATTDKQWLTLSNAQGSVAKGASKIIQVAANRAGLNPGGYTANVVIILHAV
jgi:hypothetical protein